MIAVTNTGTLPLTNIIVADNEAPGCVRTIGVLEPGESSTYSCGRTNIQVDFTNQVMATAEPPTGPSVFDTDIAIVTVIHPSIQINKSPDTQQLFMSDTATFNITVTNNGDVPLTGVAVNDPLAPGCNRNIGDLAKGAPAGSLRLHPRQRQGFLHEHRNCHCQLSGGSFAARRGCCGRLGDRTAGQHGCVRYVAVPGRHG